MHSLLDRSAHCITFRALEGFCCYEKPMTSVLSTDAVKSANNVESVLSALGYRQTDATTMWSWKMKHCEFCARNQIFFYCFFTFSRFLSVYFEY